MSAAVLREAAALMRSRAEAAVEGTWRVVPISGDPQERADIRTEPEIGYDHRGTAVATAADSEFGAVPTTTAEHIASWHPAVALAVADWLDGVALFVEARDDEEYFDLDGDPIAAEDTHAIGSALKVARTYLGSAS